MVKSKNICLIIPAYNESKNIPLVISGIRKEFPNSRIVVVDDSGKEENEKTVMALKKFKNIDIISREKKLGRGSAVIEGFKYGLKYKNVKYFYEIDADFSHDTTHLIRFMRKMNEEKVGMVIGSRYTKGGKSLNVSLKRKILSKMINKFLFLMLNVNLSDYTSGYRLYERKAVEYLAKSKMKSSGFITLSEITYKLNKRGFKIGEVPVTISTRKYGKSTMGFHELSTSLLFILKMKIEEEYLVKLK